MRPYKLDTTNDLLISRAGLLAIAQVRLCKKPSLGRVTGGKPLRVWLFYWVPAFAGTTILGFLHSLK